MDREGFKHDAPSHRLLSISHERLGNDESNLFTSQLDRFLNKNIEKIEFLTIKGALELPIGVVVLVQKVLGERLDSRILFGCRTRPTNDLSPWRVPDDYIKLSPSPVERPNGITEPEMTPKTREVFTGCQLGQGSEPRIDGFRVQVYTTRSGT